jgi:hypothetical protein
MMKPATLLVIGLLMILAVLLFEEYLPAVLLLLSGLTVVLILVGTLVPVQSRIYRLEFLAHEGDEPGRAGVLSWRCIEGRKLDPGRRHSFECHLEITRVWQLGVIGVTGLLTVGLVLAIFSNPFRPVTHIDAGSYFLFFLLCFASLVPLGIATRWLLERQLLARSRISIGNMNSRTGAYTFSDLQGSHYGGTKIPSARNLEDNTCVVFYASTRPDINKSSCSLAFHRLLLH